MIELKKTRLPESVEVDGSLYAIHTSFKYFLRFIELLANKDTRETLMKTVRMMDTHEEIIGLSGHMLAVSRKKTP